MSSSSVRTLGQPFLSGAATYVPTADVASNAEVRLDLAICAIRKKGVGMAYTTTLTKTTTEQTTTPITTTIATTTTITTITTATTITATTNTKNTKTTERHQGVDTASQDQSFIPRLGLRTKERGSERINI